MVHGALDPRICRLGHCVLCLHLVVYLSVVQSPGVPFRPGALGFTCRLSSQLSALPFGMEIQLLRDTNSCHWSWLV